MIDTYYLNIHLLVIITLHLLPQFIFDLDPPSIVLKIFICFIHSEVVILYSFTSVPIVKLTKFQCYDTYLRFPPILLLPNARKFVLCIIVVQTPEMLDFLVGAVSLKEICLFSCTFFIHCRTIERMSMSTVSKNLLVEMQAISFQTLSQTVPYKFSFSDCSSVFNLSPIACLMQLTGQEQPLLLPEFLTVVVNWAVP